ncbi:MAG TPA: HAMP domain-containing sensor histidine kinase [Dehalococcoidia bacterium]|jgi:signal transduction histidine kinase|nr:HAMP domain-containing sensor histidine kinase [Dehalococcoidia bacterium]
MFGRARWRLTLWFAGTLAVIIVVISAAVLYTGRRVLFDQVDDDLVARAERESRPLAERLIQRVRNGGQLSGVEIGPAFTAGGYFYAVSGPNGNVIGSTANADPAGLASEETIQESLSGSPSFVETTSSEGEHLRVYLMPLGRGQDSRFVLQVGRSTEPERDALRRLTLVLVAGGGAGVLLALGGGFWLGGRALRPIQSAMDSQRAFVADASHELRTPLSLIRANAEILQRSRDDPVNANIASVDDIIGETDRLNALVGQMLTLARADSGENAFQMAPVDLNEVVADTVRKMRLLSEAKGIALEMKTAGPLTVNGDAARLRELATILLDNAIKYSDNGGAISIGLQNNGAAAVLTVADNGRGIPPDALPRIFDRFYRADKARSRAIGGVGLGLAIAKWISEAHNGTIAIESSPGSGTTVTVELPAQLWPSF